MDWLSNLFGQMQQTLFEGLVQFETLQDVNALLPD